MADLLGGVRRLLGGRILLRHHLRLVPILLAGEDRVLGLVLRSDQKQRLHGDLRENRQTVLPEKYQQSG